jgi:hypothetical protein
MGDPVDGWRIEVFEPDRRQRLLAEIKLPGRAWLKFEVDSEASDSTIHHPTILEPIGLSNLLHWYAPYPVRQRLCAGLFRGILAAKKGNPADLPMWPARASGCSTTCQLLAKVLELTIREVVRSS